MPKKKIAFVARTVGLEYDDRIRKECISLKEKAEVKLFVHFSDNRIENGITSYGVPFQSYQLQSRKILPSSKLLIVKALELYYRIKKDLSTYDTIWAHEEYTFMFPLLLKKNTCIWDLHEIPFHFESKIMRPIFNIIEKKSKKLIHANPYRIRYMSSQGLIKFPDKHVFLNNFPDTKFLQSQKKDEKFDNFIQWLGKSKYVYIQGISSDRRYPINTLESIMQTPNLKAVVIGNVEKKTIEKLKQKYNSKLTEKIFFRGKINQLQIPNYLKNAFFSIILYDSLTPNNRFCEPNRLYQSLIFDIPVIVGNNEPMKDLIDKFTLGVSLPSDGRNIEEIFPSIAKIINSRDSFVENIKNIKNNITWDKNAIKENWWA